MRQLEVKHTPFTKGLMKSKLVSNRVKKHILKFIKTTEEAEIQDLFKMMTEFSEKLDDIGTNLNVEEVRLNGILLIIVQDEIKKRNEVPIKPTDN